jgi:hypothetical protein
MSEKLPTLTVYANAITLSTAKSELADIRLAGGRTLKDRGKAIMPVKRDMLLMPAETADLVLDACEMLFAAILSFEGGLLAKRAAVDAVSLVEARMQAGEAEGIVTALFYGPTAALLVLAAERAPIAFYAMAQAAPGLKIIDRLKVAKNRH